ncbi:MAG: hypothetical protein A3F09_02380 [Chlamydiae bacterium RIFCSPHIGHO2_12_FULL_49_11]|nr:MAG: hypothetical protein A3F09_02380 [Chlamydiae bacterium RIFCSPHIGHO2_12_FULL_49_11]
MSKIYKKDLKRFLRKAVRKQISEARGETDETPVSYFPYPMNPKPFNAQKASELLLYFIDRWQRKERQTKPHHHKRTGPREINNEKPAPILARKDVRENVNRKKWGFTRNKNSG